MSMQSTSQEFEQGERVSHPDKGAGTIYQDQAGFENAMVVFDDRPSLVTGVRPGELTRITGF